MLEVRDLHVYYGGIHAVQGVSLDVQEGSITALIGANGAGKTTVLRAISGLVRAREGRIRFSGSEISAVGADRIVSMGISQVPEGRRIFPEMTVLENLELGAYRRKDRAGIRKDLARVFDLFPRLAERKGQQAGTLSGGEQQMLAIGRGLMAAPRVLLLDEPSMGLAPLLVREIFEVIREINSSGVSILVVEQNARKALAISDNAYVMESGRVVLSGPAAKIAAHDAVRRAYLGG